MSTWAEDRARVADNRPRRWIADVDRWREGWPEIDDADLERATDAQLANYLNLLGWPVRPSWRELARELRA